MEERTPYETTFRVVKTAATPVAAGMVGPDTARRVAANAGGVVSGAGKG